MRKKSGAGAAKKLPGWLFSPGVNPINAQVHTIYGHVYCLDLNVVNYPVYPIILNSKVWVARLVIVKSRKFGCCALFCHPKGEGGDI